MNPDPVMVAKLDRQILKVSLAFFAKFKAKRGQNDKKIEKDIE
jgi:hypothetical protein